MKKALIFLSLMILGALVFILKLPSVSHLKTTNPTKTIYMDGKIEQEWIPLSQVSPYFIEAVLFSEDIDFYDHHGLSWRKIKLSYLINRSAKRVVHGGSTITQQVAKNLFLSSERSLFRKFKEAIIALMLEKVLSKERILEIYMNIMELGPGVFGIESASQYWFQCSAKELTPQQAINIAFIASDPKRRNPLHPTPYFKNMCNYVLTILAGKGMITHEEMFSSLYLPKS